MNIEETYRNFENKLDGVIKVAIVNKQNWKVKTEIFFILPRLYPLCRIDTWIAPMF